MIDFSGLNYWAIAVAWLVNIVVGALWYSPLMFGKEWEKYTGVDMLKIPQDVATRIISFVALSGLIQAITLAVILHSLGASTVSEGVSAGLLLWFGLVTATTVGVTLYSRRSWKFLWLNSSYFLVVMVINSIVLSVLG